MKPTNEELRATFEKMRPHRANWPGSFDEALRLPLIPSILLFMTKHPRALALWLEGQRDVSVPQHQPRPFRQFTKPLPALDWKRRASGEKESDYD